MGEINIICGPMFSGKTDELLRTLNRLNFAKKNFLLFKPSMDNRFSEEKVVSHGRNSMISINVENSLEILRKCEENPDIKHIGIDEIQFLPKDDVFNAFKLCVELKKRGYKVYISALDMDYLGNPFGLMGSLMAIADSVKKLKACCSVCGEDASMSAKITNEEDIIDIGGEDKYKAMCYKHWQENLKKE